MPRVLHVTEAPEGGVFSLLKEFTREQYARGYEVHVLAARRMKRLAGVTHHDWSIRRSNPLSYPGGIRELHRTVADVKPDVIHLHSFYAGFFGRLPLVRRIADVPVVYQPHAWSFDVFGSSVVAAGMRSWERWSSRRTSVLVANCSDEIEEGREVGIQNRSVALGVAVDTDYFAPVDEATRQRHRCELGVPENASLLLCLGRLARQKGQDQLVAAWERAPIPNTELVFVGLKDDGDLRQLAPTQWGRSIKSIGQLADVRPWIWACDALVLPSRYETVSLAVAEAMSCARPAVATRVSGVAEILTAGRHPAAGAVVALGDMSALLDECRRLLVDRNLRQRSGQAARVRAAEQFNPAAVADRLELAYREAMHATAARS